MRPPWSLACRMDIVESVGNALSADGGGGNKVELALMTQEDSDAVLSVVPPEQKRIGALLSNIEGSPSALYRGAQVVVLAHACMLATTQAEVSRKNAGMAQLNDLLRVTGALWGAAFLLVLLPLGSARTALMPGGALEKLGAGVQKISAADAAQLARLRVGLAVLTAALVAVGCSCLCFGIVGMDLFTRHTYTVGERFLITMWGLELITVVPLISVGWWPSMATASCLCRDNIIEVIKKLDSTSPADDNGAQWKEAVATPALALYSSMATLSHGWSSGLLGLSGLMGLLSVALFTMAINLEYTSGLDAVLEKPPGRVASEFAISALFLAFLPLLLALDLATTSSRCDLLMDTLNQARINHGLAHNGPYSLTTFNFLKTGRHLFMYVNRRYHHLAHHISQGTKQRTGSRFHGWPQCD